MYPTGSQQQEGKHVSLSKNADAFGRRPDGLRRTSFFLSLKSDDFPDSPASGLMTLSILLLTVGEVRQNLDNEKGGECRPSQF
jgi:hypothetical protein